jgi:thymidylate synthase (FAD)
MIAVHLIDHMGDDLRVANAARQSFDVSHAEWSAEPRTPSSRSDPQLVDDLGADGHLLPFRHPHATLACTAPLPIARQLGKHQVGLSWSETSRRYKTRAITCHRIEQWRAAPDEHRQGSGDDLPESINDLLMNMQERNVRNALDDFKHALQLGATPEQARFLLPQSMDVSWTWTGSLLAWAHLVRMRSSAGTQAETRDFARQVAEILYPLYPCAWAALLK